MLSCFICGADASAGWVKGFTPAPDSQKLALCPAHDNEENRLAVAAAWQILLNNDIAGQLAVARYRAKPKLQTATVRFMAGGMLSFLCLSCAPTEQGTLRIEHPDGEQTFIPMQHVREYSLRPSLPEDKDSEEAEYSAPDTSLIVGTEKEPLPPSPDEPFSEQTPEAQEAPPPAPEKEPARISSSAQTSSAPSSALVAIAMPPIAGD